MMPPVKCRRRGVGQRPGLLQWWHRQANLRPALRLAAHSLPRPPAALPQSAGHERHGHSGGPALRHVARAHQEVQPAGALRSGSKASVVGECMRAASSGAQQLRLAFVLLRQPTDVRTSWGLGQAPGCPNSPPINADPLLHPLWPQWLLAVHAAIPFAAMCCSLTSATLSSPPVLQWFLAVHAAIPFVAMLRKAVLMPKWAILLTLIGSSE